MSDRSDQYPELPAAPGRIALFAIMALAAGIAVSWWIDRPPGPECSGYVTVRKTLISAQSDCRVGSLTAAVGSEVHIGDPLLTLQDDQLLEEITAQQQEVASLEAQLARAQAKADLELQWRMRTLDTEICEIQLKSATFLKEKYDFDLQRTMLTEVLTEQEVKTANNSEGPFRKLSLEKPTVPPERLSTIVQLEAATNAAEVSAAQVEICGLREASLLKLKEELPARIRQSMGVDVIEGELSSARRRLEFLQARNQALTITSPAVGRVGTWQAQPGDLLSKGDPIVELLDDADRYLIVHVPSQAITRFETGSEVTLTFPGGQSRRGEVSQVSPQAERSFSSTEDSMVLVHVVPTGAVWPEVPIGSLVKVRPAK